MAPKPPIDPYVRAQQEFERIESSRLLETDPPEYVAAMTDVVREYLAARVPGVRRSNTSGELIRAMGTRDGVEAELPAILARADLIKFAQGDIGAEEARVAGVKLKAVVDHVEARLNPESEVAKRIAGAKERAAA